MVTEAGERTLKDDDFRKLVIHANHDLMHNQLDMNILMNILVNYINIRKGETVSPEMFATTDNAMFVLPKMFQFAMQWLKPEMGIIDVFDKDGAYITSH